MSARPTDLDPISPARAPLPCEGHTDLFFPINGDHDPSRRHRQETAALKLCASCPVRIPCRDLGRQGREHGTWGGETERQRARLGYAPKNHPHPHTTLLEATG